MDGLAITKTLSKEHVGKYGVPSASTPLEEWGMDATSSLTLKQLQVTTIDCNMAFGVELFTHFDLKYFSHELEDTSSLKLVPISNSHPSKLNSQQFPCLELKAHDGEHKDALVSTCMEAK